jgi:hypothetical protein
MFKLSLHFKLDCVLQTPSFLMSAHAFRKLGGDTVGHGGHMSVFRNSGGVGTLNHADRTVYIVKRVTPTRIASAAQVSKTSQERNGTWNGVAPPSWQRKLEDTGPCSVNKCSA